MVSGTRVRQLLNSDGRDAQFGFGARGRGGSSSEKVQPQRQSRGNAERRESRCHPRGPRRLAGHGGSPFIGQHGVPLGKRQVKRSFLPESGREAVGGPAERDRFLAQSRVFQERGIKSGLLRRSGFPQHTGGEAGLVR